LANKVFKVTNEVEHKSKGAANVSKDFDRINKSVKESRGLVNDLITKIAVLETRKGFARSEADLKKVNKELEKANREMDSLNKTGTSQAGIVGKLNSAFGTLGTTIIAAFAVHRIISFGKEAFNLAAKAEGVKIAFDKLNNPNLLASLRTATRGTVSDLQLMQNAVKADKFKIPLDQLASFFQFATIRSRETGQSVDYLVDSIVNGIGRKSALVLDNLGISVVETQAEFRKTGDFAKAAANIIEREIAKSGKTIETTADKVARMDAKFENLKVTIGNVLIEKFSDKVFAAIDILEASLKGVETIKSEKKLELIANETREVSKEYSIYIEKLKQAGVGVSNLNKLQESFLQTDKERLMVLLGQSKDTEKRIKFLRGEIKEGRGVFLEDVFKKELAILDIQKREILLLVTRIKVVRDFGKETKPIDEETISSLRLQIQGQKDLLEETTARYKDTKPILEEILRLERELAEALGAEAEFMAEQDKQTRNDTIAAEKELNKILLSADETFNDAIKKSGDTALAESLERIKEKAKTEEDAAKKSLDLERDLKEARIDIIGSSFSAINDIIQMQLQKRTELELEALRDQADERIRIIDETVDHDRQANDRRFELGLISKTNYETQQVALEKNAAARKDAIQKELARKEAELKRKQFIADKIAAIARIGIDTAVNVAKVGIVSPLAPFIIAGGAIQVAVVAATPVPAFAKGKKKGQKAGMSLIGEEGAEYMYVPDSATIINNKQSVENEGILAAMQRNQLKSYIMNDYIPKVMIDTRQKVMGNKMLQSLVLNSSSKDTYALIKAINKSSQVSHAAEIGKEVAKSMSISNYYQNYNW